MKERKENEQENNLTFRSRARGYWQKTFSTYWYCVYAKSLNVNRPECDRTNM